MIISRKSRGEKGMIEKRRGQAAMEFLMTYGWAILVVLIAIGALAYFGVLNPGRFLPESCTIAPGISCDSFQVRANLAGPATSRVILRNGLGQDISLRDVGGASVVVAGIATNCTALAQATWTDGHRLSCTFQSATGVAAGQRFKGAVVINYRDANALDRVKDGEMVTEVEP